MPDWRARDLQEQIDGGRTAALKYPAPMPRTADKSPNYPFFEKKGGKQPPTPPPAPKSQATAPKPPASSGSRKPSR